LNLTDTEKEWNGEFGKSYINRNYYTIEQLDQLYKKDLGISRYQLNEEFLSDMDRQSRVLEIGCNIGNQLKILQSMDFKDLWGIEISEEAFELAKSNTKNINIIKNSAFDVAYKDEFFDMVFTTRVLIHINPKHLNLALDNIYRLTRKYIWGFEYFAEENTPIRYRGKDNLLWKNNFMEIYLKRYPNLRVVKEKKIKYLSDNNIDQMFLLEKKLTAE
jgi:pseudaminic acid biosynthesis-associated methylase